MGHDKQYNSCGMTDTMRRFKQVLLLVGGITSLVVILLCTALPRMPRIHQGYGADFTHEISLRPESSHAENSSIQLKDPHHDTDPSRLIHLFENISLTGPTHHTITADVEWLEDLSHLDICNKSDPFILGVVLSAIPNKQQRINIRKTWANPEYYQFTKIRTIFVLGSTTNETVQKSVEKEIEEYQDIIQSNYIDSYRNLTYKTLSWMTWVEQHCLDVPWIAKIDDDIVVNPFGLNRFLVDLFKKNPAPNSIIGRVRVNNKPMRSGKWVVTKEEYPARMYPPFVLGPAYIVGRNAIGKLLEYAPHTPFLWLEDVYMTGLVARSAGIKHVQAEKVIYARKISRKLYAGRMCFLVGANEKSRKNAWTYIIKYSPFSGKKR